MAARPDWTQTLSASCIAVFPCSTGLVASNNNDHSQQQQQQQHNHDTHVHAQDYF